MIRMKKKNDEEEVKKNEEEEKQDEEDKNNSGKTCNSQAEAQVCQVGICSFILNGRQESIQQGRHLLCLRIESAKGRNRL